MRHLTEKQAYLAMHKFLDDCFQRGWEDLGGLLGSMSLLPDGSPADPALAKGWAAAVEGAVAGEVNAQLR
jgi:hypothetical protein